MSLYYALPAAERRASGMFQYHALLGFRHRLPVFPVAVYIHGGEGLKDEQYAVTLFGQEQLRFRYKTVALAKLGRGVCW
jgi:hypothetical protein